MLHTTGYAWGRGRGHQREGQELEDLGHFELVQSAGDWAHKVLHLPHLVLLQPPLKEEWLWEHLGDFLAEVVPEFVGIVARGVAGHHYGGST